MGNHDSYSDFEIEWILEMCGNPEYQPAHYLSGGIRDLH